MGDKFIVAKGRSILHNGVTGTRQVYTEGMDVTGIGLKNMEHHVKSGHVVKLAEAASGGPPPEGIKKFMEPIKADPDVGLEGRLQVVGKWTCDPATLEGKSLEQLNVMIKERDNTKSAGNLADAIGQLSANWKPKAAPLPAKK
jgi:hypothetical protein